MYSLIVAEFVKLRRTLALHMVIIAPALVVLLAFVLALQADQPVNGETDPWTRISGAGLGLWNLLMLPLFITLETALTGFTEHSNNMWKYLCSMPHSRRRYFFAKICINSILLAAAQIVFSALLLLSGYLFLLIKSDLGYSAAVPWPRILWPLVFSLLTSLLLVVIHTWISLRFRSIVIALGSGIGFSVASMIIISSRYSPYFPWTIPGFISMASQEMIQGFNITDPIAYSWTYVAILMPIAIVVCIVAALDFSRGDVQ